VTDLTPDMRATSLAPSGKPEQVEKFLSRPEASYLTPCRRRDWQHADYVVRSGTLAGNLEFLQQCTKALSDAGVPLALGTDSPNIPGMLPWYSIHDDLRNTVQSALTPYQALSAGTRVPGEIHQEIRAGSRIVRNRAGGKPCRSSASQS